jgi:hypothetical protein
LQQVGSNVVATGSGAIDLTGLTFTDSGLQGGARVFPDAGVIITGSNTNANVDEYGGFGGPLNFGTLSSTEANSGSGDRVGIAAASGSILVPQGYVSGTPLSDSATYSSQTFATLSVTPGTYEWTWGTGPNQNFTLVIPVAGVPDSGSTLGLFFLGLLGLVVASWLRSLRLA